MRITNVRPTHVAEDGDLWFEGEGEYDLRVTQRLVLQPRLDFSLFAQDIPEQQVGAGLGPVACVCATSSRVVSRPTLVYATTSRWARPPIW